MTESAPLRVCCFESRRADDMRELFERQGANVFVAPSMKEVPLENHDEVLTFARGVQAGEFDAVVWMTGVGARALFEVVREHGDWDAFAAGLQKCSQVVRGPKPAAVLREFGIRIDHRVPEPNTWRDILAVLDAGLQAGTDPPRSWDSIDGLRIAVQEYGKPSDPFYAELRQRGADVTPVAVYRWELPDDIRPLKAAVEKTIAGEVDVLVFTSAQQLAHVLQVAEQSGLRDDFRQAARRRVIASIGPTASEAIRDAHLPVDIEPEHPKMGHLVRAVLAQAKDILASKPQLHPHQ